MEKIKTADSKNIKKRLYFVCEICHSVTPIECEGSEPNTCAMCMPLDDVNFNTCEPRE